MEEILQHKIWVFWTDKNEMSDNRKRCLDSILLNSQVLVELVNHSNLSNYVLPDFPIHSAYEYLSSVHKSDYLRTYFMHFYGGGYSDIKYTNHSWKPYFLKLDHSDAYGMGYTEIGPGGVAPLPGALGLNLRRNWNLLLGNGAYIWKPNNEFTSNWLLNLHQTLDMKHDALKAKPARTPRDKYNVNDPNSYPLRWSEILGDIFHPLCYEYRDKIIHGLVPPSFTNYQ
jgi:Capsular polysaccharide synthesis protein